MATSFRLLTPVRFQTSSVCQREAWPVFQSLLSPWNRVTPYSENGGLKPWFVLLYPQNFADKTWTFNFYFKIIIWRVTFFSHMGTFTTSPSNSLLNFFILITSYHLVPLTSLVLRTLYIFFFLSFPFLLLGKLFSPVYRPPIYVLAIRVSLLFFWWFNI